MQAIKENPRRIILIGLVGLILLCLVAVLVFNVLTGGNDSTAGVTPESTTAPTEAPTETLPTAVSREEVTPTPTRVITEEPLVTPTEETPAPPAATATPKPAKPTATAPSTPTQAASSTQSQATTIVVKPGPLGNLLVNGDFEQGFDQGGVALGWQSFKNDNVQAGYGRETAPYVESGVSAQRIAMSGAGAFNRYAGLSQQVTVVAGQVYTLTMHGQIRSGGGNVEVSSYGYRLQYAVSLAGLKNWENVPEADWVELPWDEQLLNNAATQFYSYTTTIRPTADKLTLFVRAWNKWPDPGEAQYTLDSFSLVGPTSVAETVIVSAQPSGGGNVVPPTPMTSTGQTRPLPVTGLGDGAEVWYDGRFWIGLLMLLLLAAGAIFKAKWSY